MAIYLALIDIGIHNGLKDTKENPQRSVNRLALQDFLRYVSFDATFFQVFGYFHKYCFIKG